MIIDLLLDLFHTVLSGILAPFPEDTGEWLSHIQTILDNLGALNYFLPIAETFAVVIAVLFIFPVFAGISLSLWILAQLRGSSARG